LGLGFCFGDSNSGYLVYGLGFRGFGFCIRGVNVSGFEVLIWGFKFLEVFYCSGGIQGWEKVESNTGEERLKDGKEGFEDRRGGIQVQEGWNLRAREGIFMNMGDGLKNRGGGIQG
jgi:hypothetical protein